MSTPTAPRPSQVAFAGWLAVGASVVAVVTAFAKAAQVDSEQSQASLTQLISTDPVRSLGVSLAQAQDVVRVTATLAAVCGAATAVLGWFVLRGSRGSRLTLSILAVPLLVTGLLDDGLAPAVVAASATMLWLQPARSWFRGDPVAPAGARPDGRSVDPLAAYPPPRSAPYPFRSGPSAAPSSVPSAAPSAGRRGDVAARVGGRPTAVIWACVLTWTFSAAVVTALGLLIVALAGSTEQLLRQVRADDPWLAGQGWSDDYIATVLYVATGTLIAWAAAAAVVAVLAFRRVRWAMLLLRVSAGLAGGLCLLMAVGSLVSIVVLLPCAATFSLMLRPEVRAWYAARG